MDELYLTTRDVADILGFRSTERVVALIENGMLPCERIRWSKDRKRKLYRLTVAELLAYVEAYDPAMLGRTRARCSIKLTA